MADRYCGNCGHQVSSENRFCPNCGSPLGEISQGPTPPDTPPDPGVGSGPDISPSSLSAGPWMPMRTRVFILLVCGTLLVGFAAALIWSFYLVSVPLSLFDVFVVGVLLLLGTYFIYKGWQLLE